MYDGRAIEEPEGRTSGQPRSLMESTLPNETTTSNGQPQPKGVMNPEVKGKPEDGPKSHGLKEMSSRQEASDFKERLNAIFEELEVDKNEILNCNPEAKAKVKSILEKYMDVFAEPGHEVGETDLLEFNVELVEDAKPYKARVRPLNPKQRDDLRAQLDQWLEQRVIEPSTSPWGSALVPVLKKDGTTRWAVDYRPLNKVTIPDSFPLPNIQENLERLAGSKIFTTLDAAQAYMTIRVNEKSKPLLAFVTPFGTYSFRRMPFGARNSGNTYSRFVEILVNELRSPFVVMYIDDIIGHTPSLDEHLEVFEKLLKMHADAGIKLRGHKTKIFREEVEYLGHLVNKDGTRMRDAFIQKVVDWPTPETTKQLSTFLGFTGYYRTYIQDYSYLTNEMNAQKKNEKLDWTEVMQKKFEALKECFKKKPIRSYPRYDLPDKFILTTDYSKDNLGAILSQVQEGEEKMISATGRKTTSFEKNYASHKGELAAIIYGLRQFEHILRYRPFTVRTDSGALKHLHNLKDPKGIMARWLNIIQSYEMEIVHLPGKKNKAADAMSRCSHLPLPSNEEEKEQAEFINSIKNMDAVVATLSKSLVVREQKTDETLNIVRGWITKGHPSKEDMKGQPEDVKAYHQLLDCLIIENDILYMTKSLNKIGDGEVRRTCIPESLRPTVFYWSHQHLTAGHFGQQATLMRAKHKFYFPGMAAYIYKETNNCSTCLVKKQKVNLKEGKHVPKIPGFPGEVINIDLVGPMPESNGKKYILTCQDGFTRFCRAWAIPNKEATTVATKLIDEYLCAFGLPLAIHSDNGKEFANSVWQHLCDKLQMKKSFTVPYAPQGNPVERFHRTLHTLMRTFLEKEDPGWTKYLGAACLAYNSKVNSSTGITPFMAMLGREARLPVDIVMETPERVYNSAEQYSEDILRRFKKIFSFMRENQQATIRRNTKLYSNTKSFKVDDKVWYLCPRLVPGKPSKITDQWLGPYKIIEKVAEVLYKIKPADYEGAQMTVHVSRLAKHKGQGDKVRIPKRLQIEDDDETAEEIRPPRVHHAPTNLGVPVSFATPEAEVRDHPRIGGDQLDDGEDPPEADEQEMGEPPDTEPPDTEPPDTVEENLEPMPDTSELLDTIDGENGNEIEMPEARPKRSRCEDEEIEDLTKKVRRESHLTSKLKEGITRAWQQSKEMEAVKSEAITQLDNQHVLRVLIKGTEPRRQTGGSSCYDVCAARSCTLHPGQTEAVPLNLRLAVPRGYTLLFLSRSGLALKGITTVGGVIDSDYRGEIQALLHNSTKNPFKIKKGQRISQGLFLKHLDVTFEVNNDEHIWNDTTHHGFGSTG